MTGHSSPELLYVETKWASLVPYAKVADLLKEVLPVVPTWSQETVRKHLHATAQRMEQALGEERDGLFTETEEDEAEDIPSVKRFGFVQTYGTKPRRRLWELLKSQGMQDNQTVIFLSDGGDTVRKLQTYLHPASTHIIDWFHVAMKLTVLQQQNKAFIEENQEGGASVAKTLERVKHYLWHGNVAKALECLGVLLFDLDTQRRRFPTAAKLELGVAEFDTYIRNNQKFIPNFGERYRQGDTISTAFVESTINQVVSKRFVKR